MVKTARSRSRPINAGVSQGSVLGPLLFLVYVNDICDDLLSISRLFADDTSLTCSASHVPDIEGIINHDLQICQWAERWLLSFNPSKAVAMLFTTKNVSFPLTYCSMMSKFNL